jgi:hypothetical protein
MAFLSKDWFRGQIDEYLIIIKAQIAGLESVTGQHVTGAATFATLPVVDNEGDTLGVGDTTNLTTDDVGTGTTATPQYPAGFYIWGGASWGLLFAIPDIADILLNIGATDPETVAGVLTDKYASVKQIKDNYALLGGDAAQAFLVNAGTENTNEALNANQFIDFVTAIEAQADWDAA